MVFNRISHSNLGSFTLKNEEQQVNNFETTLSVNDELFQQVRSAENHSGQIIGRGQSDYVDGIKDNVFERVYSWLNNESDNIFTLYGNMGSGKSYFSARLFQKAKEENTLFDSVAFSSQQTYYDTTKLQNMLISVAHQLYERVSVCRRYFSENPLVTDSVFSLVESVLVAPFENVTPEKPVLVIVDGLDEYPRVDCEAFLEAVARLRVRFSQKLKIFFSSRPEPYIITQSVCDSADCVYHIEKNGEHSYADCESFIDSKCGMTNVFIDKDMKHKLIEKSECSLKYLDCFFNDIGKNHITDMADFIASLPSGLNHYYRDQLSRYFGDDGLKYYQSKIMPLLELLCVAKRPLKMEEAADILGCRVSDISSVISRSGTLLWRNVQNEVRLFQSESIREFLMDDRYCPEKYFVDSENGKQRIMERLNELMDIGDDLESNAYIFKYAVDHIFDQTRLANADFNLLIRMVGCYLHKFDVMNAVARRLLDRSESEIRSFLRQLYADNNGMDELIPDAFCVRIAAAVEKKKELAEKLFVILDNPMMGGDLDFLKSYSSIRHKRASGERDEALTLLQPYLEIAEDADICTLFRHNKYLDQICRVYRSRGGVSLEEVTRLHVQAVEEDQRLCSHYERKGGAVYMALLRSLSVSFDQLARWCECLNNRVIEMKEKYAGILQSVLQIQTDNPDEKGYFLSATEVCYKNSLRHTKICQQSDPFSTSRAYDLCLSFSELGRLYARKDFPKYDPNQALAYYDDGLSSVIDIAKDPKSEEKYMCAVNNSYTEIIKLLMSENDFEKAKQYITACIELQDLSMVYHPGFKSMYRRACGEELRAELINEANGLDAAEEYYLNTIRHYKDCFYDSDEKSGCGVYLDIYRRIETVYRSARRKEKYAEFLWLEFTECERLCKQYGSENAYMYAEHCCSRMIWDYRSYDNPEYLFSYIEKALDKLEDMLRDLSCADKRRKGVNKLRDRWATVIKYPNDLRYVTDALKTHLKETDDYLVQVKKAMDERAEEELEGDVLFEHAYKAISACLDFVNEMEHFVECAVERAVCPKETLKAYAKLLIETLSEKESDVGDLINKNYGEDEIKEKLDYYNNLLAELTAENPS